MKLLIDEMFPAVLAVALREQYRHDALAVDERDDLRGLNDNEVFAFAQRDERAVMTENARDYRPIARDWQHAGGVHCGLVLTTNRRFPRARPGTLGKLVTALAALLDAAAEDAPPSNFEIWL